MEASRISTGRDTQLATYLPPSSRIALIAGSLESSLLRGSGRKSPCSHLDSQLLNELLGSFPRKLLYTGREDATHLLKLTPAEQMARIVRGRSAPRATATLCVLLARSRLAVHGSPDRAYAVATLGRGLAAGGPASSTPGAEALACAYQANARRADGRLTEARPLFDQAHRLMEQSAMPRWVVAEIASLQASWFKDARRFDAAELCLSRAAADFRSTGDVAGQVRVLIKLADLHWLAAEPARAVEALGQALPLLAPFRDSRLFLFAHHNLCRFLLDLNDAPSANALFELLTPWYEIMEDRQTTIRRWWLDGLIACGLGRPERAEEALRTTLEAYVAIPIPFYAALVSLDLALLFNAEGRTGEVAQLAAVLPPLFEAQGIQGEATAAALMFHRAAAQERLNAALLDHLRDFFLRAQVDREARFTPEPSPSTPPGTIAEGLAELSAAFSLVSRSRG